VGTTSISTSPVWDASLSQGYSPAIKFAGTFKHLEVKRDTESKIKVSCPRTQNTWPGLKPRPKDHEGITVQLYTNQYMQTRDWGGHFLTLVVCLSTDLDTASLFVRMQE